MKSIDEIRSAFIHVHHYAIGKTREPYMEIPPNPNRDADLILSAAIDELAELRAASATARALAMEEAAQYLRQRSNGWRDDWLTQVAEHLESLAPLSPTLIAVPVDLVQSAIQEFGLADADQRANWQAPEDDEVRRLCERLGYGAVMDSAARQWRRGQPTGAFLVGSAIGLVRPLVAALSALLPVKP